MVALLSQDWLDLRCRLGRSLPERPGATARIQRVVTGAPDGDVTYVEAFDDGRLVSATLGLTTDEVDLTLTETFSDAVAIAAGALDLHAGYMQGRVKAVGDIGALMAVLPVTQSPEHRALVEQLAAQTTS